MEMRERLSQILESLNLTRNEFALKVGVQRSNVTHVLEGRNKPGLDFIEKTIKAFPQVDVNWLMTGEGQMFKNPVMKTLFERPIPETIIEEKKIDIPFIESRKKDQPNEIANEAIAKKRVDKITILYSDKTFEIYYPE